jgi:signal transduction histidine kinase
VPGIGVWSLRRRLAVALAVLATVLFAMVFAAVALLVQVRSEQHAVIDRYFTAASVSNLRLTQQIDAETAIRGYALSGAKVTLRPIGQYRSASYVGEVAEIRSLLHGDPSTVSAFNAWNTAAMAWNDRWVVPTIREVTAHGGDTVTTQQVLAGKALFDNDRAKFATFLTSLVGKREAANSSLRLRTTLLFGAVLLVTAGLGIAGGATWWVLRRWVLGPLAVLGSETRQVTTGALEHEVAVDGPAEVQQLASDIDEMRREIVEQLAAVERARVEIEASRRLLVGQAQDLARSNRDLEQFAYVASHDLQEPLRKVASFCQMLDRRYSGQLDERADQYIAFAVDGAKRMQELINDLLAFSRVGRLSEAFSDVDLQECLDAAVDNLSVAVLESNAEVHASGLPHVYGDGVLLTQLLQNLVGNSIKFRGDANPQVRISARVEGEHWEFSCADNGLGIESQYADRIFVIFQRLHGKDEYPGTGIGLALCKRIVEHHGGQIWFDSSAGAGATFRWTLPVMRDAVRDTASNLGVQVTLGQEST